MVLVCGNRVKDKTGREGKVIETIQSYSYDEMRTIAVVRVEWSDGSKTKHADVYKTKELEKIHESYDHSLTADPGGMRQPGSG